MPLLLWPLVILIPYLLGKCVLRIFYRNRPPQEIIVGDCFLMGTIAVIGLAEAAHLTAVILGWSFSDCVAVFCILTGAAGAAAVLLLASGLRKTGRDGGRRRKGVSTDTVNREKNIIEEIKGLSAVGKAACFCFTVMAILQIAAIVTNGEVYREGDMTVETVNSFLGTNTIYGENPLTGRPYELGIPLRLRILGLPTLYAILSHLSGLAAWRVVWYVIPVFTLLLTYCAYYSMGQSLFRRQAVKKWMFLVAVALLFWAGDYMYGVDGFGLLCSGFRGTVIRACVLLPYTFYLCLQRMWKGVAVCILAEACIVWTFYGMGACLFAALSIFAIQKFVERKSGQVCGKEAPQ
nr:DUF6077 domain-containing protein [uncultured Acetatifactor sp.]